MSKIQRQTKARKDEVVHQEMYDDAFLPSAEELAKLKEVNPDLIGWIMQRTEDEQKFRHRAYDDRTVVIKETIKCEHQLNYRGLIFCFIVLLFGMGVGGFLIYSGNIVSGSIFAGADLIIAAGLLYNRSDRLRQRNQKNDETES